MFPFRVELDKFMQPGVVERGKHLFETLAYFPAWGLVALALAMTGGVLNICILQVAAAILAGCSLAACLTLIGYSLLFRMQWRLLELLATVIAGTIPTGVMIRTTHLTLDKVGAAEIGVILVYMLAGCSIAFTGSIIGTQWLDTLGEQRSFHRLGILFLAWGGQISVCAAGASMLIFIVFILGQGHVIFGPHNRGNWQYCIMLWSTLLVWIPILIVKNRYRTCGGVNAQR